MPDIKVWTREDVLALPDDGNRYELVDRVLLVSPTPSPLHQMAVSEFNDRLKRYTRDHRLGTVLFSPADLDLRSGQLVQPDIFVLPTTRGQPFRRWADAGIPSLIVEVLSPNTARHDRVTKRRLYQRSAVPTYWIVDLDARVVEVWTDGAAVPAVVDQTLLWSPNVSIPPLQIDLAEIFREIIGDEPTAIPAPG